MSDNCHKDESCGCSGTVHERQRKALKLEYITISYNVIEAVLSVGAGIAASVLSLVAFGVDSVIEVSASVIMLWRLYARGEPEQIERMEKRAQKLVALSFFALGAMVAAEALRDLLSHSAPENTLLGIAIAAASAVVMPLLARAKRNQARALNMSSLASEAAQTNLCGYLSIILLTSLLLYRTFGWWWSDAVGALLMLPIIFHEGVESWRGKNCCC